MGGYDVVTEFLDNRDNCDQGGVRIDGEIRHLITQVDTYGDERNATYTLLRKRLKIKLDEVNAHRTVPLKLPAPSTFNAIVNETPAIRNLIGRKGINHARQQLTIVGQGPRYRRVGEMIEMDCWEMHVMSLYKATGAWSLLDEEVKDALAPIRIWIAVALDVASGCILGLYFSATESTAAALGALRMVFEDKSWLAAWAGCQRDWLFPIGVDCVQTDGGSVFKTADFWVPALSCIPQVRKKAGDHKRLNGHVERLFGTMDRGLLPNFSARTFSNTVQLGDYKPEQRPKLVADAMIKCVIRWVVDSHHLTKPDAPLAQQPYHKFWRLYRESHAKAPPSRQRKRFAFGIEVPDVEVGRWGIRYANVFYYRSEQLALILQNVGGQKAIIKVDPQDIGCISVKIGRKWIEISGPPELQGMGLSEWKRFNHEMERRYRAQEELDWPTVAAALRSFERAQDEALQFSQIRDLGISAKSLNGMVDSMMLTFLEPGSESSQSSSRSVGAGTLGRTFYPQGTMLPPPDIPAEGSTTPPTGAEPFGEPEEHREPGTAPETPDAEPVVQKSRRGSWGLFDKDSE